VPDPAGEGWETDDCVRRTVVLPASLAKQLAARAERRRVSVSELIVEYAAEGLRRDDPGGGPTPGGAEA
jgi:hypothetical protein